MRKKQTALPKNSQKRANHDIGWIIAYWFC